MGGKEAVELAFPGSVIGLGEAAGLLRKLGTEREALHRMRLMWCCIGMPLTAPIALLPMYGRGGRPAPRPDSVTSGPPAGATAG